MYKAKYFLFKTLLLFSIAFLMVVGCQFQLSATPSNSYEWSKTAKWKILSTHFHEGLIRIGFTDPLGSVIPPDERGDVVRPLELVGYMDKNGKQVIPPQFFRAGDFSEGLASVRINPRKKYPLGWNKQTWEFGYIDKLGKIKIKPQFVSAQNFSDGLAGVYIKGEGYGYIDYQGRFVIKPTNKFVDLYPFYEGRAIVHLRNSASKCNFINKQGRIINPEDQKLICDENIVFNNGFSEGLLMAVKNGKYGYIDRDGKVSISARFDYAQNFSDGLAKVLIKENGQSITKYIDKRGHYILTVKPAIKESFEFKNGLALAQDYQTKKYGFINKKGVFVISPIFDNEQIDSVVTGVFENDTRLLSKGFSEGIARVFHNGRYYFINTFGKELFPAKKIDKFGSIMGLRSFKEGIALVESEPANSTNVGDWHRFFVNKYGNVIIQQPKQ